MVNECFFKYMVAIGEDYENVNQVIDSFDMLSNSVDILQEEIFSEVKMGLTRDNLGDSIEMLKAVQSLESFGRNSYREKIFDIMVRYSGCPQGSDLSDEILNDSFVEMLYVLLPYLGEGFKSNLENVFASIDVLYREIADDLSFDIQMLEFYEDSKLLGYITYLSPRLSKLGDIVCEIVGCCDELPIYDDLDKLAIFEILLL